MTSIVYDSVEKIWKGPHLPPASSEIMRLAILRHLNQNPEKMCQISADDGSKRSNAEVFQTTLKIAFNLRKRCCSKGDVVAFVCRNSHNLTPSILAALFLGAPANALDVCFTKDETTYMFRYAKPKFVFCDNDVVPRVQKSLSELDNKASIFVTGQRIDNLNHIDELLEDVEEEEIKELFENPPEVSKDSCALIVCSSGSTGMPKGIAISHSCLYQYFLSQTFNKYINSNGTWFCFSSLYWVSGYFSMFVSIFFSKTQVITTKPFSSEFLIEIIDKYNVSSFLTNPTDTALLLEFLENSHEKKAVFGKVKLYVVHGNNLSNEYARKLKTYMPNGIVHVAYGTSETGCLADQDKPALKNCAGYLNPGVCIKILDDEEKHLGVGESGNIWAKSQAQFMGYYGNRETTRAIMDTDGWICTGDLGHFDEEGLLFISGRRTDIIRYKYYFVSPSELEGILESHPDVLHAVVIGLPDPIYIELPTAVVVRHSNSSIDAEELQDWVKKKVMKQKHLHGGIFFFDKLPMAPNRKIRRNIVKDMVVKLCNK